MDMTSILNKGHRRYIDKWMKKRRFGKCEACDKRSLLIRTVQTIDNESIEWNLCNKCYNKFIDEEV